MQLLIQIIEIVTEASQKWRTYSTIKSTNHDQFIITIFNAREANKRWSTTHWIEWPNEDYAFGIDAELSANLNKLIYECYLRHFLQTSSFLKEDILIFSIKTKTLVSNTLKKFLLSTNS